MLGRGSRSGRRVLLVPHSGYAIVPSRPTNRPRRRKRGRWAGETWGAGRESWGSWGTQRGRWNGGASLVTTDNLQADPLAPWVLRLPGGTGANAGGPRVPRGRLHSPFSNDVVCLLHDSSQVVRQTPS